ncbi:MAG: hypothetical protein PHF81_11120 [Flavobacterium sp.]|nr:hypothetical protein [Flavobacterium sp.]
MTIFKNNSALSRIFIALFSQGVTVLITLISLPFLISLFGIKDYAIFGLFLTFQALSSIIEGGASVNVIKEVSYNQLDAPIINSVIIYKKIFYISLLISFLAGIIVFYNWDYSIIKIVEFSLIIAASLSLRLLTNFYKSISLGLNNHNYVNIFSIFFYFLRFVVPIILGLSIDFFLYFQLSLFVLEFFYFKMLCPIKSDFNLLFNFNFNVIKSEKVIEENKFTKNIILLTILALFITNIDKLLLSIFGNQEDFGSFQAITNLSGGLLILLGPLNGVFQPLLISVKSNNKLFLRLFNSYWLILIVGFGFVTIFLQVFSEQILKFWLGNAYSTILLELFNYHLVFSFGICLMSFAYLHSLVNNVFHIYIKYLIAIALLIAIIYCVFFILDMFVTSIFLGSIISLIFSFVLLVKFGKKIFIPELKYKSYIILIVTFTSVLLISSTVFLKSESAVVFYVGFVYFLFLLLNINLFILLIKTFKNI